jgi:hypothetical protein
MYTGSSCLRHLWYMYRNPPIPTKVENPILAPSKAGSIYKNEIIEFIE